MDMDYEYYEYFMKYWLPVYRKQILECKYENDTEALLEIYENINKSWHLKEYKKIVFEKLGINYISTQPDIDSTILKIYFKNKRKKELLYGDPN